MALESHEFLEPVEILYWFKYNGQKTIISNKNITVDGSKRFCGECILTVDRRWVSSQKIKIILLQKKDLNLHKITPENK